VLEGATGQAINGMLFQRLTLTTGMVAAYAELQDIRVVFSRPRDMARFGLLMLAGGTWNGNPVLADPMLLQDLTTPSQTLNQAYGHLWWLNGGASFMLPGTQLVFPGTLLPSAPADAYHALGRDAQILGVAPGEGLVVVRMGEAPDGFGPVPIAFTDQLWELLREVACTDVGLGHDTPARHLRLAPNPAADHVRLVGELPPNIIAAEAHALDGRRVSIPVDDRRLDIRSLSAGMWIMHLLTVEGAVLRERLLVVR
jgi:CubicO group peptidase (beta-lactamase class C family)